VLANVAQPRRAEQRVGTGMGDDIGVRVTDQPPLAVEHDAAEDQPARRIVAEAVDVEALTDPDAHGRADWDRDAPTGRGEDRCCNAPGTGGEGSTVTAVMDDVELLTGSEFFADVPNDRLIEVARGGVRRPLVRGDVLFAEGDVPDHLYVVVSGRIAIASRSVDGRESVFALMESGDLFGEMGFLDRLPRSAEARALEASTVLTLPYEPVQALFEREPTLLWSVVRMLSRRIRSMDEALADSVFLDVTGRTAKRLLELAGDKDDFVLPVTQEELAGMVGASRERVNKAIASFIRLGWIEQQDRRYHIVMRDRLALRSR
jgi:CRP/FNR family transcriptional regulator, cyclic AMP receptor protein